METNTTAAPARPPGLAAENHTHNHHHHPHILPSSSILTIILPTTITILLLSVFLIILTLRRQKSAKNNSSPKTNIIINNRNCTFIAHSTINVTASPDVKGGCLYGGNSSRFPSAKYRGVQVFTIRELELATDKFSEASVIGNGGCRVVYRGVLRDGTVAAIKMLRRDGKQRERAFRTEVDLLSNLHSPNIVELLGYCADQHHRLLVLEFMPNGTLQHLLHPSNNQPRLLLNWGTRLSIALDCARALESLHDHADPHVFHGDFKCSNILLDQNFRAKLSDFRLARTGSDKIHGQALVRASWTTGYLAPEYVSTGKLTTKSDVYSYGVVLLELLTGRVPVDTKRPPGEHVLVSWALPRLTNREKLLEMVDPALQGQYSKKDLIQIAAIAAMCVQPEADYRPLITDIAQSLVPLVKNLSPKSLSNSLRFNQRVSPRS
ncbi:probable serine/threonine-protein kinase PBL7 [Cornus florida]|uniref:probable serine/threonine-protein kinase PBL7 n=1 Tax=Cornus florida TaxID=4283 RepID=UPI00289C02C8|nr:probable serine/threonine-protein kinase PBL7 [Cornus florida]